MVSGIVAGDNWFAVVSVYDECNNTLKSEEKIAKGQTISIPNQNKSGIFPVSSIDISAEDFFQCCANTTKWVVLSVKMPCEDTLIINQTCLMAGQAVNQTLSVNDKDYSASLHSDENQIMIDFFPPIPEYSNSNDRLDSKRILLDVCADSWAIARLNSTTLILGKEKEYVITEPFGCLGSIPWNVSGKRIAFEDISWHAGASALFCEVQGNGSCMNRIEIPAGKPVKLSNEYINVWNAIPGYTFCGKWADASVFSDIIELNSTYLTSDDSNGTALESIHIPKNSTIYAKLIYG